MPKYDSDEIDELQSDAGANERWRASEPPPDPWGDVDGADEEGNWRFQIIGEEVDHEGNILHEVRWDDWHRSDGTKTTWEDADNTGINSTPWTREQRRRRRSLAGESLSVEVPSTTDVHNDATYLRSQAYEEKLLRAEKEPQPNLVVEMARLLAKHQAHIHPQGMGQGASTSESPLRSSQRTSARQNTFNSTASSSTPAARGSSKASVQSTTTKTSPPIASSSKSQTTQAKSSATSGPASTKSRTSATPVDKGKRRTLDLDSNAPPTLKDLASMPRKRVKQTISSSAQSNVPEALQQSSSSTLSGRTASTSSTPMAKTKTTPSMTPVHQTTPAKETPEAQRKKLGDAWTTAARERGGARVSFFNDVDDEAIPLINDSFRYLECSYLFARGIDKPDSDFLTLCSCDECGPYPATCGCQDDWEQEDFAYTSSGLWAFNVPSNIEVIECNKRCSCSIACINRVSQRPRDVPIQVFKTHYRGWGVRATMSLERGKVLGIYTGRLIRRETSRGLSADLSSYCFDLDGDEMVNNDLSQSTQSSQGMQRKYSVDSRREGNWTRFINHSCSPNLEIYLVVHDKPPGSGMPYIAFVANQHIPAYTELTFDYHPEVASQLMLEQFKAKGKKVKIAIPEGAKECLCEAAECRGYLA